MCWWKMTTNLFTMKRIHLLSSLIVLLAGCNPITESPIQNAESNPTSDPVTLQTSNLTEEGIFLVGNGLTAHLSSRPNSDGALSIPILKFWYPIGPKIIPGKPTYYSSWWLLQTREPTVTYDTSVGVAATRSLVTLLQIVELDNTNQTPEVLFSSFSGGAHCCSTINIFSQDENATWQHTKMEGFDGYPIGATTIDGIDDNVIVTSDNRFLYMFDAYALSLAPDLVYTIQAGKFVDISDDDILVPYFKNQATILEEQLSETMTRSNGFWAGYVGIKARAGEFDDGWAKMLDNYDRDSNWGLDELTTGLSATQKFVEGVSKRIEELECSLSEDKSPNCQNPQNSKSFPDALEAFLQQTGYIN